MAPGYQAVWNGAGGAGGGGGWSQGGWSQGTWQAAGYPAQAQHYQAPGGRQWNQKVDPVASVQVQSVRSVQSVTSVKTVKVAVAPVAWKPPSSRDELCAFFRGTGTDVEFRTLEFILAWDDTLMEVCHDYIQWVLPTDEVSRFNSDAPILDEETQRIFSTDLVIRKNLRRVLQRFLKFLGLADNFDTRADGEQLSIQKTDNFERRMLMCWRGPMNHNWRRLSRALRCLGLSGLEEEQQALLACLEELIVEHPGMIEETSIGKWVDEGCVKSKLVHSVTAGYAAAVLASPNLQAALCKQYFHKYDMNGDGSLCLDEVTCLTRELHISLGLPLDTITETHLSQTISEFGHGGELSAEEFPKWFAKELENTSQEAANKCDNEDAQSVNTKVQEEQLEDEASGADDLMELRPAYLSALSSSPMLLKTLCGRFFKRYDKNSDGRLVPEEAMKCAQDLNVALGLPIDSVTMQEVEESLPVFSETGSASLNCEEFPAWFQGRLRLRKSSSFSSM